MAALKYSSARCRKRSISSRTVRSCCVSNSSRDRVDWHRTTYSIEINGLGPVIKPVHRSICLCSSADSIQRRRLRIREPPIAGLLHAECCCFLLPYGEAPVPPAGISQHLINDILERFRVAGVSTRTDSLQVTSKVLHLARQFRIIPQLLLEAGNIP